jgi:hypothetical protein
LGRSFGVDMDQITPEQQYEELLRALREGVPMNMAITLSGFSKSEVARMRRADPLIDRQIKHAMLEKERIVLASLLRSAADGNTDAARWYLERRSDDWVTVADKAKLKLAKERWRLEQEIIKAELQADPARMVAENTMPALQAKREPDVIDVDEVED